MRSSPICIAAASLAISLALAEQAARFVRQDAFPFLNIFLADEAFGVVLSPSQTTHVRSRLGHITEVTTNSQGFRGAEWRAPADVLLLGDSQMFGYGVALEDAVASQLERKLGLRVLNAAVPTWGPAEYVSAIEKWAPVYHPRTVLFVGNMANDWFEAKMPNNHRTAARDGWSTTYRRDRPEPTWFPGRLWLFSRCHLYFFVREIGVTLQQGPMPAQSAKLLLKDLPKLRARRGAFRSRLGPFLAQAQAACARHGCTVVAAALPMDVQVDDREWAKYRSQRLKLAETEVLLDDFVADAHALGLDGVNLLGVLRAASPGAFLPDDYHMSAQGHAAIAAELAGRLRAGATQLAEVIR